MKNVFKIKTSFKKTLNDFVEPSKSNYCITLAGVIPKIERSGFSIVTPLLDLPRVDKKRGNECLMS